MRTTARTTRTLLTLTALVLLSGTFAQVNRKGAFQMGVGMSLGAHATHFENSYSVFGITFKNENDDGAVTFTVPIEVHYGLSERFSLGICMEPGRYLDSAGTHPNSLFLLSITPRYYLINRDRFALLLNADIGGSFLKIADVESGPNRFDDTYSGGHFRLGGQVQWYFTDKFGINGGLKYAANNFKWHHRDPSDPVLAAANYEATLRTSGIQFQIGLQLKL